MSKKSLASTGATLSISIGLLSASSAVAAPTLTLGTGPDPVESITTQLQATGTSESSETILRATYKPTGGQGCAANFNADTSAGGSPFFEDTDAEPGPFATSTNHMFTRAGGYLLCGWLYDDAQPGEPIVATASLTISVRPPHLAFSISAPQTVQPEQTFQVATTAQAEVERTFTEDILPNTERGCPANASAAGSTSGLQTLRFASHSEDWEVTGGPFSETSNASLEKAGQYLVCGYVQYPSSSSTPEMTASTTIAVVAPPPPPPPCVVPAFTSTTKPQTLEPAITAAGCVVGQVRTVASRTVRSGYVLSVSPSPGQRLAHGTAVNITVSTGPPCVVPHIFAGSRLSSTELHVRLAHCAVGHVHARRSRHYRRGRVLYLRAQPGQVLHSQAPVEIVISSGRHRH